jgi:hypothetical protein
VASDEKPSVEVARGSMRTSVLLILLAVFLFVGLLVAPMGLRGRALTRALVEFPSGLRAWLATHAIEAGVVFVVGSIVSFVGAWLLLMAFLEVRLGRARFFEDRIELEKYVLNSLGSFGPKRHTVSWSELVAFRDDHTSHVTLVRRPPRFLDRVRLTIPTATPELREVVVRELVARGVPRA